MNDDAVFCAKCGNKSGQARAIIPEPQQPQEQYIKEKNRKLMAVITAVIVVIIIAGVFFWLRSSGDGSSEGDYSGTITNSDYSNPIASGGIQKEPITGGGNQKESIAGSGDQKELIAGDIVNVPQPEKPETSVEAKPAESISKEQIKQVQESQQAINEPISNKVVPGEMVLIPAGEFIMGSNNKSIEDANAFPEHTVKLPAFWIDKYEVTNKEFMEFSEMNNYPGEGAAKGSDWRIFAPKGRENFPVIYITWNDANEYCKSKGKRLPTEQEWEYAARGPNGNVYPWGMNWENRRANTNEASREATEIGVYEDVSYFGVHDMLGNVQEWTASWYMSYPGGVADSRYGEKLRVVRGLSPTYRGSVGNLWLRFAQPPTSLFNFGCRCAKDATSL